MASEYRWVVIYLCVWLASIDSIWGRVGESTQSAPLREQSETDYIRLEDLIRQEILGVIKNGVDVPTAGPRHVGDAAGWQVRSRKGSRCSRWRDRLLGQNDSTQGGTSILGLNDGGAQGTSNGSGGLLGRLRRPQYPNNRVQGMYDYFVDSAGPEYVQYPFYDYLPSGNQMYDVSDGYSRRPNVMWSGASASPSYVYNDQPARIPGRRVVMRPPPPDTFNGEATPTFDSVGQPGRYLVQIPGRGRQNNLNGGSLPSSQVISLDGDGYTIIPAEVSNGATIPIRVDGKGNNQGQVSRLPTPVPQTTAADLKGLSTDIDIPRVSGGQPSSQSFISNSGGRRQPISVNTNDLPVDTGASSAGDGMFTIPERVSNSVGVPIRVDGRGNNQKQISRISIPGTQSIPSVNMETLDSDGLLTNIDLPRMNGAQPSSQTFTIPSGTSGSGGSRIQLPTMSDLGVEDGGFSGDINLPFTLNGGGGGGGGGGSGTRVGGGGSNIEIPGMNGFKIVSDGSGLRGGSGSNLEIPNIGSGVRMGQNQIKIPALDSLNLSNGGSISTAGLPIDTSRTPGSFRVTTNRAGQTGSMSDADAQPAIDIRNLEEPSYSSNAEVSSNVEQTVSSPPSNLINTMTSEIESPVSLANQGASFIQNEPTNLSSDVDLSKMVAAAEDEGKAAEKESTKNFNGFLQSFRWGKSGKPAPRVMDDSTGTAVEIQSNLDQQPNSGPAEPEMMLTDGNQNLKMQVEPAMNSMNFAQNGPESFSIGDGNAMGPKRKGTNQSGSYYIIQHPDDYADMFANNGEDIINQLKPQMSKFTTRNQMPISMSEMSSGAIGNGIQGLESGQMQNAMKPSSMTKMMSSGAGGDGSSTFNVGAGRSPGRSRQYKVLVVDGDHELLRSLKLPGASDEV